MRRKLALILTVVFAVAGLAVPPAGGAAAAEITEKPYYIIDEEFAFLRGATWPVMPQSPSGWDIKTAGGELTASYNTWFKIADKHTILPVEMTKWFRAENEGSFTFEFRFNFTKIMEDTSLKLRMDEKSALSFVVKNGDLCLETAGGAKVLEKISERKEYGVRADFDLASKKISVFINGELKLEGASFKDDIGSLNNVYITTGAQSTGEMFLNPVKLYKNFTVNECFMTAIEGALPGDWAFEKGAGSAKTFKVASDSAPDLFSVKLEDSSNSAAVSMTKKFEAYSGPLSFEFKTLFVKKAVGVNGGIYSGDMPVFAIVTEGGKLCYLDAGGAPVVIDDYIENLWYAFRATLDFNTKKAALWVNGRKAVDDIDLPQSANSVDTVKISTSKEGTGELWVDDIIVAANPPLPEDYVPVPKPAQKDSDKLVGIQSCSMWREGHHLGWDYISGWPERYPLIGFYDEGSTEVADWETKFLVENGVDFEVFSWFRPYNGNAPIKKPYGTGYSLHQGYYYSEYSDMLKYMIYWEQGGAPSALGSEDFRKHIVPFWIEYYFKDQRYFRIDGKPVLSILTYSGLTRDFGNDPDKIKAELDYLRKACRDAGVGEIIIITNSGGTNKDDFQLYKRVGIDAIYAYNWSVPSKSIESQKKSLQSQQDLKAIDVIPNLNMGFDATAWGVSMGQGGYVPLDDFENLLTWARDSFMPGEGQDSLGNRVVLFANWNEYGEGHYIMPSGLAGFGYLDAIRNVFAPGQDADNILPTEEAKIRMGRLYSVPRFVAPPLTDKPAISDEAVLGWYFDKDGDFEGWELSQDGDKEKKRVEDFKVADGMISGKALGDDPGIIFNNPPALDLDSIPYIRVKSKMSFGGATGQIYFITEKDQDWNEAKGVRYTSGAKSGELGDDYVYMWDNENWKGKLKAIRFDPFDRAPGESFAYDSIELLADASMGKIKVLIDNVVQRYDQPPIIVNDRTMVPLRGIFEALGARINWDGPTRTVTCVKGERLVELTIGNKTAYIDGKPIELDQAAEIVNDRTLVPVRFVSEALGATVDWKADELEVLISTKGIETATKPGGPNLLKDGDMEAKSNPFSAWGATATLTKKEFHDGKQALEIVATEKYGAPILPVDLVDGVMYYYGAWVKLGPDIKPGTIVRMVVNYDKGEGQVHQVVASSASIGPGNWAYLSGNYAINAGAPLQGTYVFFFTDNPPEGGTFYIDDVEVIKMGDAPATPTPTKTPTPEKTPAPTKAPDDKEGTPSSSAPSEAVARKDNIVADPGFEGKKYQYLGWGGDVELTKEASYTGSQSLKISKEHAFGTAQFPLELKTNQEYEISVWTKKGEGSSATVLRCVLKYTSAAGNFDKIIFTATGLEADGWIQLKGTYKIEEKGKISDVYLNFFTDLPSVEDDVFYLDDLIVAPVK